MRCVEGWEVWCEGEMWEDRERRVHVGSLPPNWFACSSIFSLSSQAQAGQTVEVLQLQVKSSHN